MVQTNFTTQLKCFARREEIARKDAKAQRYEVGKERIFETIESRCKKLLLIFFLCAFASSRAFSYRPSVNFPILKANPKWLLLLAFLAGCDLPGKPDPANRPIPVNKIVDFDVLYQTHCSGCHGETGSFGPAPPLNDPLFLKIVSEDELLEVITHGRAGTPMPAFVESQGGPLTAEQVRVLATGLKPRWQDPPPALAAEAPPYAAPANNPALAARGAELFATACANCHGAEGEGMDEDDAGHRNAINNAAFLSLISDQALRRLMITGRADLGMPNFTEAEGRDGDFHPLTSDDLDALVALLSTWRESGSQPSAISYQPIQKKSLADSR